MKLTVPQIFAAAVSTMVVAAVGAGFFVAGSPTTERARRFDDQRIQALQQIAEAVGTYADQQARVPSSLDELEEAAKAGLGIWLPNLSDPKTGLRYRYESDGSLAYRLCGTFEAEPRAKSPNENVGYQKLGGMPDFNQRHVGETCWNVNLKARIEANATQRLKSGGVVPDAMLKAAPTTEATPAPAPQLTPVP